MLPASEKEKRSRQREITSKNKRSTAHKVEMSFFKGALMIQNQSYKQKVQEPDYQSILQLSSEDIERILSSRVQQGELVHKEGNNFLGFSKCISTYQEIRETYINLKLRFPQASHIMCAYNIPGVDTYYSQDYCDGGDFGVGKHILQMMTKSGISSRAIFVARFSGHSRKIGEARITGAVQAAESVMQKHPINNITGIEQYVKEDWNKPKQALGQRPLKNINNKGRGGIQKVPNRRIYHPINEIQIQQRRQQMSEFSQDEESDDAFTFARPDRVDDGSWCTKPQNIESW